MAAAVGTLVALIQFANLLPTLDTNIASDLGDPVPQAWQVAWDGHAVVNQPLLFWQANQFFPEKDTLAFSDALVGYTPAGLLGSGQAASIARYNVLFLFAFALAFLAAWLLASELGTGAIPALVGASAFAWAPWRMQQGPHLHVLSSGPMLLAIFLLLRGYRRQSPRLIVAGFVAALWQESIGFSLGLQLDYLLLAGALIGLVCWLRSGKPKPTKATVLSTAGGSLLLLVGSWTLMRPYLRVIDSQPQALHHLRELYVFSPHLWSFMAPPKQSALYSGIASQLADHFGTGYSEKGLYLGLPIVVLTLIGLFWQGFPRALKIGLAITAAIAAVLSLGVRSSGLGHYLPYRFLFEYAPGWQGIRTPGRIHTITTLVLAMLTAGGAALIWDRLSGSGRGNRLAVLAIGGLCVLVLIDGSGFPYAHPKVAKAPSALASIRGPLFQLPAAPENNRLYLLWSTNGFTKMVNGRSTVTPESYKRALAAARHFPSPASIRTLEALGVRNVVVHTEFANQRNGSHDGKKWLSQPQFRSPTWKQAVSVKNPSGLGVSRSLKRPLVIYHLPY